jgi:hypothetical protein
MTNPDFIYGLYSNLGEGEFCFYIGRTNNMHRRLGEHKRDSKTGTEFKYQMIRSLDGAEMPWNMKQLAVITTADEKYEDWYIYEALLDGQPLTNQKAGDARKAAEWDAMQRMRGSKTRYSSASEFLTARQREIAEARARAQAAKLAQRHKKPLTGFDTENTRFVDDLRNEKISPALQAILNRRKGLTDAEQPNTSQAGGRRETTRSRTP